MLRSIGKQSGNSVESVINNIMINYIFVQLILTLFILPQNTLY